MKNDAELFARLPKEDKQLLIKAAEKDGRSLSAWLRYWCCHLAKLQLESKS